MSCCLGDYRVCSRLPEMADFWVPPVGRGNLERVVNRACFYELWLRDWC